MSTTNDDAQTKTVGITTDSQENAAARRAAGEFVRGVSSARHWIGNDDDSQYPVRAGRYHLYVAYNCPYVLYYYYFFDIDGPSRVNIVSF